MSTTWLAVIAETEFQEFARRVRGLKRSYAAYCAQLDRREADWTAASPDGRVVRVRVSASDLDRFCGSSERGCSARELGGLANLKDTGWL
ncbi:hypothetical protein SAMN02745126_00421 [Enhydrobacter aerosaccus]|uniref:Uncharacterized protein n=1 Tax=Enhydrobacter aerosaccus TaxID=225324 RepID=A0A1T4JSS9_9HYPH|nr:hypothetical protein SAMN02745126_00421 [Enhydrobacter aerosaccus]